ncbi:MAG: hypothetical protein DRJ31_10325 [Candidatus Methanomethylicota archaeon]|uniref:OsmC family peroxiredoxin n=1 Tax=Thermoproteota archaeon TaxID=2056631 RepID=A0A497EJK3_9CREN|nr:MAG: hypothetical protein DRJ31_10325 [Candidatus Verstraetearchaeota archaeon]
MSDPERKNGDDVINNIDLRVLRESFSRIKEDSSKALEKLKIDIEWRLAKNYPQMYSEIVAEKAPLILESELQTFLGGKGIRPSPMQYFFYGVAASYLSTIMLILSERGIQVSTAKLELEAEIDYSKLAGISDNMDPIKHVIIYLQLKCDLSEDELLKLIEDAKIRCPVFSPMNFEIKLKH